MIDWLCWSDRPIIYAIVTWGLILATLYAALLAPSSPMRKGWRMLRYPFLVSLTLLASRWPSLFYPSAFNTDEAQAVTHAITLTFDPVFYRSVVGLTIGPLMVYPLTWPVLFGITPSYLSSRLTAVLALSLALTCLYLIAGRRADERAARLSVLPPLFFFAFTTFWDFTYFTSEHAPIAYLSAAVFSLVRLRTHWSLGAAFCAGFFTACAPLAKIQATPPALFIGLTSLIVIWMRQHETFSNRLRYGLFAIVGALLPLTILSINWIAAGVFHTFWQTYILDSLSYTKVGSPLPKALINALQLADANGALAYFLAPATMWILLVAVLLIRANRTPRTRAAPYALVFAVGLLITTLYAVAAPGRSYHHYVLLLIWPIALVMSESLLLIRKTTRAGLGAACVPSLLFVAITVAPLIYERIRSPNQFTGLAKTYLQAGSGDPVVAWLRANTRESDRLAPWGWRPDYNAEAGRPQGVRVLSTIPITEHHGGYDHFLAMILEDLKSHPPEIFIDTVAPGAAWLKDRSRHGHDVLPVLAKVVDDTYIKAVEIDGVRVYRRRQPPDSRGTP